MDNEEVSSEVEFDEDFSEENKYLTFKIEEEIYGMSVLDVVEIIRIVPITNIPESLPFVKGIINLRGQIIPVIDVRLRFDIDEKEYGDRTCIVVVSVSGVDIGMIVDSVSEVIEIPVDNIDQIQSLGLSDHRDFVKGIGKIRDEVKILLDLEKLLGESELAKLGSMAS